VNILKLLSIRRKAITLIIWNPISPASKGRPGSDLYLSGLILASKPVFAWSEISRAIVCGYSPGKHNVSHFSVTFCDLQQNMVVSRSVTGQLIPFQLWAFGRNRRRSVGPHRS